ncbi:MAG: riboflavin kinase, partial [bacterium]|nr:riboflavin kinase [bacterium]
GWKKTGNTDLLRKQGKKLGFTVDVVQAVKIADKNVSSSSIRKLITEGQVGEAAKLLGRDYEISGRVIHGRSRGHDLGFPTANLSLLQHEKIVPGQGIFAILVCWQNRWRPAAAYVGKSPTFSEGAFSIEVHMIDFSGDLYGEVIRVRFVERLRSDQKFRNTAELSRQITRDCEKAKVILGYVT